MVTSERFKNLLWERRLGIETRGVAPVDYPDALHYATMAYSTIWAILRNLELGPSDVFADIGSGKGRVLCCAAREGVKEVLGVDLSPEFCRVATANADGMRGRRAPIVVKTIPAQECDYSAVTAVFMFDPFGADTMEAVLAKIEHDTAGHGVRIAYANPTQAAILDSQPWLERTEFWKLDESGLEHSVAFYRSADL